MAKRGQLTQQVQAKARELLGRDITQAELRLMPYILYCAANKRLIERSKLNGGEVGILAEWEKEGRIALMPPQFTITKAFYDAMNELACLAYVTYDEQPEGGEASMTETMHKTFTTLEWVDTKPELYDLEKQYDERVLPLVEQILSICGELGMPCLMGFAIAQDAGGIMYANSANPISPSRAAASLLIAEKAVAGRLADAMSLAMHAAHRAEKHGLAPGITAAQHEAPKTIQ